MTFNEKIDALKAEMADLISAAREEGRALNEEEQERAAAAKKEIDALRASADLENTVDAWEDAKKDAIRAARKHTESTEAGNDKEERAALMNYILRGQVEGTGAYGGYTVPTRLYDWIVSVRDAENYVRRLGTVINVNGPTKIATEGSALSGYWVSETGSITEGTQEFGQADVSPKILAALVKISKTLLADSAVDIYGYLAGRIGRVFGQMEETAFIKGSTGNNEPEGVLSAGITVTRTAANAVTAAEIIDFFYSLPAQYARNASWLISGDLAAKLSALTTGTGGIFAWSGNLADGPAATLLGRPVYISKDLDAVTTNKTIAILGDWSYYYISEQGPGIEFTRLNELFAGNSQVGLLAEERVGGVLTNTAAFKVLGTKTT